MPPGSVMDKQDELPLQIYVVGDRLCRDQGLIDTCRQFKLPVKLSEDGGNWATETMVRTVFVLEQFSGPLFQTLNRAKQSILGPPAVRALASLSLPLLVKKHPVFCLSLLNYVIVFSGFRRKKDLERLLCLVHWCGGSVQRNVGTKTSQVVAASSSGDKYQYATTFSIPVLREEWLDEVWKLREEVNYNAMEASITQKFKLQPFTGNAIMFHGFDSEELQHMKELLLSNGGQVAGYSDVTHVVVDENNVDTLPPEIEANLDTSCHLVKGDWFWISIQIEAAADVVKHRWMRETGKEMLSPNVFSSSSTSLGEESSSNKRKRELEEDPINILAAQSQPMKKGSSELKNKVIENSLGSGVENVHEVKETKRVSARQKVFHELLTTEKNYVRVLECIERFSREAEDEKQKGGALLDQQEIKIIFGKVPPILKVHNEMLTGLRKLENSWTNSSTVGSVILTSAEDLLKAYPPFVNFFERSKHQLTESDCRNPRFHAFLKACERRPECGRQSLSELLIRPIQRLPSICLLLTDLLKHTQRPDPAHPDCLELKKALGKIREVMTHLNEEKRKTEGQIHIFDIYSAIENCPASVVSSHRSLVSRSDCVEVAAEDTLCRKGNKLTLFLFTDILLVAKRKNCRSRRSPTVLTGQQHTLPTKQSLKFVQIIQLSSVQRVVDVVPDQCNSLHPCPGVGSTVALVCRLTEDLKDRCYTFQMEVSCEEDKQEFLRAVCRNVANTLFLPDADQLLVKLPAKDINMGETELSVSKPSRTFSSLNETKRKVGRAFSFNKTTPSPNQLERSESSVVTPDIATNNPEPMFGHGTNTIPRGLVSPPMDDNPTDPAEVVCPTTSCQSSSIVDIVSSRESIQSCEEPLENSAYIVGRASERLTLVQHLVDQKIESKNLGRCLAKISTPQVKVEGEVEI